LALNRAPRKPQNDGDRATLTVTGLQQRDELWTRRSLNCDPLVDVTPDEESPCSGDEEVGFYVRAHVRVHATHTVAEMQQRDDFWTRRSLNCDLLVDVTPDYESSCSGAKERGVHVRASVSTFGRTRSSAHVFSLPDRNDIRFAKFCQSA